MAKSKSVLDKLVVKIEAMEKEREKVLTKKMEELIKTDPDIIRLDNELDTYKKLRNKREEQEKKVKELEEEITLFLEEGE